LAVDRRCAAQEKARLTENRDKELVFRLKRFQVGHDPSSTTRVPPDYPSSP
jgi:hypothetical protein